MKTKHLLLSGLIPLAVVAAPIVASAEVTHPQRLIDRPRTNPASQLTVGGDLGLQFDPSTIGLGLFGRYGVNDALEVGVGYGFSLKDFEAKGDLGVEVAYGVLNSGNLQVAPQLRVGYDFLFESMDALALGARVQVKLNDQMAIFSGGNQLIISVEETAAVPPATEGTRPVYLQLPVGFGYQANDQVFAYASTNLGVINVVDSTSSFIFADYIPLQVGAFFSPSNTMDLGAAINFFDLKNDADLDITLSARLHI